jgi:hypothetical protein
MDLPYSTEAPYSRPPMAVPNRKRAVELPNNVCAPDEVHITVEW